MSDKKEGPFNLPAPAAISLLLSRRSGSAKTMGSPGPSKKQLGQIVLRAWKGHDWEALNRLHEKGFIGDSVGKAKSVFVTEEGAKRSEELFRQFFGK